MILGILIQTMVHTHKRSYLYAHARFPASIPGREDPQGWI